MRKVERQVGPPEQEVHIAPEQANFPFLCLLAEQLWAGRIALWDVRTSSSMAAAHQLIRLLSVPVGSAGGMRLKVQSAVLKGSSVGVQPWMSVSRGWMPGCHHQWTWLLENENGWLKAACRALSPPVPVDVHVIMLRGEIIWLAAVGDEMPATSKVDCGGGVMMWVTAASCHFLAGAGPTVCAVSCDGVK